MQALRTAKEWQSVNMVSKAKALRIIAKHNWEPTQQTATYKGEWVKSGTSFYEMLGNRKQYSTNQIYQWLGY